MTVEPARLPGRRRARAQAPARRRRRAGWLVAVLSLLFLVGPPALAGTGTAYAATTQSVSAHPRALLVASVQAAPVAGTPLLGVPSDVRTDPADPTDPGKVSVSLDPGQGKPSQTVTIILLLTVLSIAPALLVLTTAFTKVIVVLSLTRNALGTPTIPPNQVLAGLALFLSLFIMAPVLSDMNDQALQPYLKGEITQSQAYDAGVKPLRTFMLAETRKTELATMTKLSKSEKPANPDDVPMTTLIPAFVLSELKSAFIIGFVIFTPFLIIDLVVSSSLMSMGMMMLPPVMISLPFKLLLFVMVDGWDLIATALITSYH